MKSRILIIFCGMSLLWILLLLRAADLQLVSNERLKKLQAKQFKSVITLQSRRGAIVDRKGRELALSATTYSIYADPKLIEHKKSTALKLARLTGTPYKSILTKIKESERRFVWIERFLDEKIALEVRAWKLRGLAVIEEWKRVYPNEDLLAHTLGVVGSEGQGLEGLELENDQWLQGTKKKVSVRRDARGRVLMVDGLLFAENSEGSELKLTIDSELQYQLESELAQAKEHYDAVGAYGVILDAKTSAIRALAVLPGFDPNRGVHVSPELRRNRVITDVLEPGSVMKPFIIAKGLAEKKLEPKSKFFCEYGSYRVGRRTIKDSDTKHKFGWLTVAEILAHSSNIGMAKIGFLLGDKRVRDELNDFGFGQKTELELPGEGKGVLHSLPWNDHLLANISFGQGISATPLQVANGYAALVNGGILNKPYIVESIKDSETGEVKETKPQFLRRVMATEDSDKMRMMLVGSTGENSTGENAQVPGFMVGGKTGTAQKPDPKNRGYMRGAYISSFVGFIPAQDPRFIIYVAVDEPKKAYYGSEVAAPIFSKIAAFAVRQERISPLPTLLQEQRVKSHFKSLPKLLSKAQPDTQNKPSLKSSIPLEPFGHLPVVPDIKNLTAREVFQRLRGQDFKLNLQGEGIVSGTVPAVGDPLGEDKSLTVILE